MQSVERRRPVVGGLPVDHRVIRDMLRFLITSLEPPPIQDHDRRRRHGGRSPPGHVHRLRLPQPDRRRATFRVHTISPIVGIDRYRRQFCVWVRVRVVRLGARKVVRVLPPTRKLARRADAREDNGVLIVRATKNALRKPADTHVR